MTTNMHIPTHTQRWRQRWSARLGLLALLPLLASCAESEPLLSARQAQSRYDLVGGPVAYADVGDFVLENDKIRVAILGKDRSWGPGVFGGSLVDADIQRKDGHYSQGNGADKLAEIFPFANLLVPAPLTNQVKVLKDGADGQEAVVRVEGKGMFLFEAISILRKERSTLSAIGYKNTTTDVSFRTDYILRPGEKFVTMRTWVILPEAPDLDLVGKDISCNPTKANQCGIAATDGSGIVPGLYCKPDEGGAATAGSCQCVPLQDCNIQCDYGGQRAVDGYGCPVCACSNVLPMQLATGNESVFGVILGDSQISIAPEKKAGVGVGDFVFFGNQNDIFVPGHGFDEEKPVWDAIFGGKDTFGQPLAFDFVTAAGGDVSYGYYTKKRAEGDPEPKVLVPVFTSAATAFVTAALNCKWDAADDTSCENARVYEFERYLAVGDGDIASVSDVVWSHRGTPTGKVQGVVRWAETGAPAKNASVFVLRDPDPGQKWTDLDALIAANEAIDQSPGVINVVDADVGLDSSEDGDFAATLPPGNYALVPVDEHRIVAGPPLQITVSAGKRNIVAPALPTPGQLRITTRDERSAAIPAKVTVVALGADGKPKFRDGGRRPYFAQGRLGVGVQHLGFAMDGHFDIRLPAGRYEVVVSHGIEYSTWRKVIDVRHGEGQNLEASVVREVDTKGWVGADFHLHAEPSFDSGMPLGTRVKSIAAEGVDYVASTDHDVLSNYLPFVRELGLEQWLKTVVGSEVSTLEIGHYIGFPLQYSQQQVPHHGSVDWYCKPSADILQSILARTGFDPEATSADGKASTIIAHPRDGFLGWADQAGVDGYLLTRTTPSLESGNPVLRTVTCDHDAMEVFNSKRFDMIHTPTVREVQVFSRCIERIDRAGVNPDGTVDEAKARAEMAVACPELADIGKENVTTCPDGERLSDCRMRYRMVLAETMAAQINTRTPEEQAAWLAEPSPERKAKVEADLKKQLKVEVAPPEQVAEKLRAELEDLCEFSPNNLNKPLETAVGGAQNLNRPCGLRYGVLSDQMRFLESGLVKTMVGGSDSHGFKQEPGVPRTYLRSSTDNPDAIDPREIRESLSAGAAIPTYGPFLEVKLANQGPGQTVKAAAGSKLDLHVRIQTPSWFGVDRVEVYVNGALTHSEDLSIDPARILDYDKVLSVDVPGRDSWVIVSTVGRDERHLMRPVYLDVPFGELQLSRVSAIAFSRLPIISALFPPPPKIPDFHPVFPMAVSNAIFVDTGNDGRYDAPNPKPSFCSPTCDVATGVVTDKSFDVAGQPRKCSDLQANYVCLPTEQRCGIEVPGLCDIYTEVQKGALRSATGAHSAP